MKTPGTFISLAVGLLLGGVEATPAPQAAANTSAPRITVMAGSFPNRPTVADCSSFLRKTVTPSVVTETAWVTITPVTETATSFSTDVATELITVTVYETVDETQTVTTTTIAPSPVVDKRQVTVHPTAIPTYASACRSAEAYSSACSCIGVDPTTTTVATPTSTVTSTSTATAKATIGKVETVTTTVPLTVTEVETRISTATTTVVEPYIPRRFTLRTSGGRPQADGKYIQSVPIDSYISDLRFTDQPSVFTLDAASAALTPEQHPTLQISGDGPRPNAIDARLYGLNAQARSDYNYSLLSCSISLADFEVRCHHGPTMSFWYECGESPNVMLIIGKDGLGLPDSNCRSIKLYAERV